MNITTDEILENIGVVKSPVSGLISYLKADVKLAMINYGKQLLKLAAEKAETESNGFYLEGEFISDKKVNKNSILKLIKKLR
jgi:hypothetical protein